MNDFNWIHYKYLNPDLKYNSNKEYTTHYKNIGRNENRKYNIYMKYTDFNYKQYAQNYPDLHKYINNKFYLENHWLSIGINENRTYYNSNYTNSNFNFNSNYNYTNNRITHIIQNNIINTCNLLYSIKENHINYTRTFNMREIINCNMINITKFNKIKEFILIIDFPNGGGGTTFFLNTIISMYKMNTTFVIARNHNNLVYFYVNDELLLDIKYNEVDSINFIYNNKDKINKIFVNHTLNHNNNFINCLFNINKHVTTITHDFYYITNTPNPFYHIIKDDIRSNIIINKFDMVITQNIKNLNIFNKYLYNKMDIVITQLPDAKDSNELINTNNNITIICFIGCISNIKGSIYIEQLYEYYKSNNMVKLIIFGSTNMNINIEQFIYKSIEELNRLLIQHKPNIIIETSIWPETYSYTLTLMMLTQLPIIYFKKSFDSVIEDRLKDYNKAYPVNNIYEINNILFEKKQNYFYTIKPTIYFNYFWDNYFNTNKHIPKYAIYFPQFHEIKENNLTFYDKYTDIINLNNLNITDKETPYTEEYDLIKNDTLIDTQFNLLNKYNIDGFGVYYYWFDINTITNNNMIMYDVINKLLNSAKHNKKIFYIWANENWSDNPAFGSSTHTIKNTYTDFTKLHYYLLKDFKHVNYLKINNKPVFYIHHPWFIPNNMIDKFILKLNKLCISDGFDGVIIKLNSMDKSNDNYNYYDFHPNYKKNSSLLSINKQINLDYKSYIDNIKCISNVQTIFFDFDNRARLSNPNKLDRSTICINNNEEQYIKYINIINIHFNTNNNDESMILINAWNEWGEKMHIEPSKQKNTYYLDLLYKYMK